MKDIQGIRTQEVRKCILCEKEGVPLYADLPDRLFSAPGLWSFVKCSDCGLFWLRSRPVSEDIGKAYENYMTHEANGAKSRMEILQEKIALPILFSVHGYGDKDKRTRQGILLGRLLALVPLFNDIARRFVMNLPGNWKGRLLDIGCGDGKFLADMKRLGWEVVGIEPDPQAAKIANEKLGISVFAGTLGKADLPSNSFDAVTMKHVIEHVEDPIKVLRECYRILKPGGKLSIATPNTDCLQHRLFGSAWLELDPPRHFHLFSASTLRKLLESAVPNGFHVEDLRFVSINTAQISVVSKSIQREGKWKGRRLSFRQMTEGLVFLAIEEAVKLFSVKAGEEIFATLSKR